MDFPVFYSVVSPRIRFVYMSSYPEASFPVTGVQGKESDKAAKQRKEGLCIVAFVMS